MLTLQRRGQQTEEWGEKTEPKQSTQQSSQLQSKTNRQGY